MKIFKEGNFERSLVLKRMKNRGETKEGEIDKDKINRDTPHLLLACQTIENRL